MNFVVHTMGKCASRAIADALDGYNVQHAHYFTEKNMGKTSKLKFVDPYVITLTREPVRRNVSAYFENHAGEEGFPSVEHFLSAYNHEVPIVWFQKEFTPTWRFEIMSQPFDEKKGWEVYGKILVLQYEQLEKWPEAFYALTGKYAPVLEKVGVNKSAAYRQFIRTPFPIEYVKKMYDSEYAKHFYAFHSAKFNL